VALSGEHAGPAEQRRRARRTAYWLMLLAAGIYVAFIFLAVHRGHG
jgi:hypothetical protein